ncbi:MAG: GNAT family N-acetyltransferase [Deltaproteobacteria bacterium]
MGKLRRIAGMALRNLLGFGLYRLIGRGVTIRVATYADNLKVQRWLNPDGNPEHSSRRNPDVTDWVAHWYGQLAGFVQLVRHPPEHSPYTGYWLFSLYVKSPLRGAGIGGKLSQEVIALASAEGAQTVDLLVFNDNFPAIRLYSKLGFEMHTIRELEPKLVAEEKLSGRRRVVMRKQLEKQA